MYINNECINIPTPYGSYGGAICLCEKCQGKRESAVTIQDLLKLKERYDKHRITNYTK